MFTRLHITFLMLCHWMKAELLCDSFRVCYSFWRRGMAWSRTSGIQNYISKLEVRNPVKIPSHGVLEHHWFLTAPSLSIILIQRSQTSAIYYFLTGVSLFLMFLFTLVYIVDCCRSARRFVIYFKFNSRPWKIIL